MVHVLDLGGENKEKLAKELEEKEQNKAVGWVRCKLDWTQAVMMENDVSMIFADLRTREGEHG